MSEISKDNTPSSCGASADASSLDCPLSQSSESFTLLAYQQRVARHRYLLERLGALDKEQVICGDYHPNGATRSVDEWKIEKQAVTNEYMNGFGELKDHLSPLVDLFLSNSSISPTTKAFFGTHSLTRPTQEILASCMSPFIENPVSAMKFTIGEFDWLPRLTRGLLSAFSDEEKALMVVALVAEVEMPLSGRALVVQKFGDRFPRQILNVDPEADALEVLRREIERAQNPAPRRPQSKLARFLNFLNE